MHFHIDQISLLVTCAASVSWMRLEKKLNRSGYTLGFLNEKYKDLTIAVLLQKNPNNILESQYGRVRDNCVSLLMMGQDGIKYRNKAVPHTAAGPDFRSLMLSMGRRFGQIEEVVMRIYPIPELFDWHYAYWPSIGMARAFVEEIESFHMRFSFVAVYEDKQLPPALRKDRKALVGLRFAGLEGMVKCYMRKSAEVAKKLGSKPLRTSKRKTIPLLEELMRGGGA